jgi:hypothetical protein
LPIVSTDIQFRLSGGAANADPNLSLGGAMSSTEVTDNTLNNLYDNVTGSESNAGDTEYRCIFLYNAHATLTLQSAGVYISALTGSGDDEIDIGLGTTPTGTGDEQVVGNESTAPSGVTFSRPVTEGSMLVIGDIAPGQRKSVWVRRTVNAGASAYSNNSCAITCSGQTLA